MSNAIESAGFIVAEAQDGSIIWGIGFTAEGAQADARAQAGRTVDVDTCTVFPASRLLLSAVELGGGSLDWAVCDGVAISWSERPSS